MPTADTVHCILGVQIDEYQRAHCFPAHACYCNISSFILCRSQCINLSRPNNHRREFFSCIFSSRKFITGNERVADNVARRLFDQPTPSTQHPLLWMNMAGFYGYTFRCMPIPNHAYSEAAVGPKHVYHQRFYCRARLRACLCPGFQHAFAVDPMPP